MSFSFEPENIQQRVESQPLMAEHKLEASQKQQMALSALAITRLAWAINRCNEKYSFL